MDVPDRSWLDPRKHTWLGEAPGPASVSRVMDEFESMALAGRLTQFQPMATGFSPLDDILNGGIRPGELMVIGGPYGVGKTILALQIARNVVLANEHNKAMYVCFEHDRTHLLSRLICLESADAARENRLTLRKLSQLAAGPTEASGLISQLRQDARYEPVMRKIESYADRLILAKASGAYTTLPEIHHWAESLQTEQDGHVLVVVDYLQKVPVNRDVLRSEEEVTTFLTHGLKDLALAEGIQVLAIAAADRLGLQSQRMRLSDLRGSSALQYETDIGIMLNSKYDIVSREHLIYNLSDAESMRSWVVLSVEKNRAGRHAIDMEFALDAAHFRILEEGDFVRERLVDGKAVLT
jgi:replicative DNA helicase